MQKYIQNKKIFFSRFIFFFLLFLSFLNQFYHKNRSAQQNFRKQSCSNRFHALRLQPNSTFPIKKVVSIQNFKKISRPKKNDEQLLLRFESTTSFIHSLTTTATTKSSLEHHDSTNIPKHVKHLHSRVNLECQPAIYPRC